MNKHALLLLLLAFALTLRAEVCCTYDPSELTSNLFTDIVRDADGYLWIGTEYGLNKFDGTAFTHYFGDYDKDGDLYTSRIVRLLADTTTGEKLWVMFWGALQYYDPVLDRFNYVDTRAVPQPMFTAMAVVNGDLLVHTQGAGLYKVVPTDTTDLTQHYYHLVAVTDIPHPAALDTTLHQGDVHYTDYDGIHWIGTFRQTLTAIAPYSEGATYIPISADFDNGEPIYSVFLSPNGELSIGQEENGLRTLDSAGQQIGPTLLKGLTVTCSVTTRDGTTLIGTTTDGIYGFTKSASFHIPVPKDRVKSLVEAEDGTIYVGIMSGGVMRLNSATHVLDIPEGYYPTNIYVNKLTLDSLGRLWIGHYSGVDCYDTRSKSMIHIDSCLTEQQLKALHTSAVYDILVRADGVYCASNKGLFRFTNDHKAQRFTMEDGLPSNVICRLLTDKAGHIWMSTFHGISMLEDSTHPKFINMLKGNGLSATRYVRSAGVRLENGQLVFADDKGITLINPAEMAGRPFERPIVLSGLEIAGEAVPVPANGIIRTGYIDNPLTLHFTTLDMRKAENVSYEYRFLDEERTPWLSSLPGDYTLSFNRLGDGRHILEVRAREGQQYSDISRFTIIVKPPFFRSPWAIILYLLIVLLLALSAAWQYHIHEQRKLEYEKVNFYADMVSRLDVKGNNQQLVEKVLRVVNDNISDSDLSVEKVAQEVGISRAQLQRKMKEIAGTGLATFIRELRLKQAAVLLQNGDLSISQVAYRVGFSAPNVFSTDFKKQYGLTPKEYAENFKHHPATDDEPQP